MGNPEFEVSRSGKFTYIGFNFDEIGTMEILLNPTTNGKSVYISSENDKELTKLPSETLPDDFSPKTAEEWLKRMLSLRAFL